MGIQLYPPIIPVTLDAMYSDNSGNGILIKIPFELNRVVSAYQIYGFNIQIKTPFTNTVLINQNIVPVSDEDTGIIDMINNRLVKTYINSAALIPGEYYKLQLAFLNKDENDSDPTVGYQSSVATIKYTILPTVEIIDPYPEEEPTFKYTYQGYFNNESEPSETKDSYIFEIYTNDEEPQLVISSDWLFKDPDKEYDEYTFLSEDIESNIIYLLRYGVKTINNVIAYSEFYVIYKSEDAPSDLTNDYDFIASNNYDNGYINLHIQLKDLDNPNPQAIDGMFRIVRGLSEHGPFLELTRKRIILPKIDSNLADYTWDFQDFLINQGETYYYAIQQYNSHNIYSTKIFAEAITADFENSFLYDGKKQLKIQFNPKISSFKINRQEQKMETSGSQFPIFTRNGKIAYHEFPISGLISYWMDNEQLFMTDEELGLIALKNEPKRSQTNHIIDDEQPLSGLNYRTRQLEGYNFAAERKFKNKVLEWLGDGKPKFFKSPQEGNFIVRVMNVSLSPEDKLSRMLHTFSATAYELMEINSKNLLENNFQSNDTDYFLPNLTNLFNEIKSVRVTEFLFPTSDFNGHDYLCSDNDRQNMINKLRDEDNFNSCLYYEIRQKETISENTDEFAYFTYTDIDEYGASYICNVDKAYGRIPGTVADYYEITLQQKYLYQLSVHNAGSSSEGKHTLDHPAGLYRFGIANKYGGQFFTRFGTILETKYYVKINNTLYYVFQDDKIKIIPKIKPLPYNPEATSATDQSIYITTGSLFIPKKKAANPVIIYEDGSERG